MFLLPAAPAAAHGERTQEAFVRASTVLLHDVKFSTTSLAVGEELTVTGYVRVMESWPDRVIGPPEVGFLSLAMPGPVFAIKDRRLSGEFTPQSVRIARGATYPFSVTAVAREQGRWHVHPSFAVEGTGTLVGVGQWITVRPGRFTNTAALADGSSVDLTTIGMGRVAVWHVLGAVVGIAWLAYWLRRPLLARAAVVTRGEGRRLIGRGDRRAAVVFAAVVLALIGGGVAVTNATLPGPLIPLQVSRAAPAPLAPGSASVTVSVTSAEWRSAEDRLVVAVVADNSGRFGVRLAQVQIAELVLPVSAASVGRGTRSVLTLELPGAVLREHNLLPLAEPQVRVTALLFFTDATGNRQLAEIDELTSPVLPR
jgi:methane/ammonia monooxygenase subunit B